MEFNFAERTQYGRVDENMNTVYPIFSNMKLLPSDQEAFYVMDFIHEPFLLLQRKMKQATRMRQIPSDPILSMMKPTRAYQSPIDLYLEYLEEYLEIYNSSLDKSKVTNYESWIDGFFHWTKRNGPNFPLTFSNFHRTKMSNIYTSGLAISIAELDKIMTQSKKTYF